MPSPVGHALGGVIAGLLVSRPMGPASSPDTWRLVATCAAAGVAPDLDLLMGMHSGPTHGVGAAAAVGALAYAAAAGRPSARVRFAVACALAYASHILLDWLGTDTSPPIGIMALWPFARGYYQSDLQVFMAVSRRIHQPHLFWPQNVAALARELLILLPPALAVVWWRMRSAQSPPTTRA